MIFENLRTYIQALRQSREIVEVDAPVSPELEIPEIHRRVIASGGPALLFRNVKGYRFPIVCNLFGTKERVELAFGDRPRRLIEQVSTLPEELVPPTLRKLWGYRSLAAETRHIGFRKVSSRRAPVLESTMATPNILELPATKSWIDDGGRFITLPLVHTAPPHGASSHSKADNLGMYRIHLFEKQLTGMHFQIGKGGGFHLAAAEAANQPLPLHLYLGGPPALILSAIAPLPENVPELLLASLLQGRKLSRCAIPGSPLQGIAEAEFCIVGSVPPKVRHPEGPFGDHYGYYSLVHNYPVFQVQAIHHRRDAIFPATVVGKPRQEDFFLGDYLQELLMPLIKVVMPTVEDIWSYGETGFHSLTAARVKERYGREALASAFRILGEGQLSLTKFLFAISGKVDLRNFRETMRFILERVRWEEDLFVFGGTAFDSLDYASGTKNRGSKWVILAAGDPIRSLPSTLPAIALPGVRRLGRYIEGCLVVEAESFSSAEREHGFMADLLAHPALESWPLIVVVDDLRRALLHDSAFLWTTFTRFDPALDLHARDKTITGGRVCYRGPVGLDARMKPWYPKELFCDSTTSKLVSDRWNDYFPQGGVEQGPSEEVAP